MRLITFVIVMLFIQTLEAQKKYSVFYLCIGNQHYEQNFAKYQQGFGGLHNLPAATNSAFQMQQLFTSQFNARAGKVILSEKSKLLSRSSIMQQVSAFVKEIKKSKAPNPLLFLYYCGHGFSSKELEGHYLAPGNFVSNPDSLTMEDWGEQAIPALDIYEAVVNEKVNLVMLLDCCHSGEQQNPKMLDPYAIKNLGIEQLDDLMKNTYVILKALNRMTGYEPVIFSTTAGNSVTTVDYKFDEGIKNVGPLCRKSYIVINEKLKGKHPITVKDFAEEITRPGLDTVTQTAITFWNFEEQNLNTIKE